MGKIDDLTKCMALALLNYSDDFGYFLADPILVRNFCRPFDEDSTNTRRALDELSRIGWIQLSDSENHGIIGKVVNFSIHQKIDRVTLSKIEKYFDSTRIRRGLDEDSLQEGKGKEGKGVTPTAYSVVPKLKLHPETVKGGDSDPLYNAIWESFLSVAERFANYQKEGQCTKAICKACRNLNPDDPESVARKVLSKYRELTQSQDRFFGNQPFTPAGLSPLVERVWAYCIKDEAGEEAFQEALRGLENIPF